MGTILSGIQPSNIITLGNYIGAIRSWVDMQSQHDSYFCIVDMHAVTVDKEPDLLRESIYRAAAAYIACGIDPDKSTIFMQSSVSAHAEIGWLLQCHTPLGWLNRMTQFKEKAGKKKDQAYAGLYTYPVLMAGDILLYDTTHVPVGDDQKQHVELTRDIAQSINQKYDQDIFVMPEPVIAKVGARIMSLRDASNKMSKSDPSDYSRINLLDDADTIAKKIRKAKTDPEVLPATPAGLEGRSEAANLVTIYAIMSGQTIEETLTEFAGKPFSEFKPTLADLLIEKLEPISRRMDDLLADRGELERILKKGSDAAAEKAETTLHRLKAAMGFIEL